MTPPPTTDTMSHPDIDAEKARLPAEDGLSRSTSSTAAEPWTPVGHHHQPCAVKEGDGEVVTFPDGGLRAWLVVLGASHVLFATFGFVVSNVWSA